MIEGAAPHPDRRRVALLLERVAGIDGDQARPSANERLERIIGGHLARLLVGALAGSRPGRSDRF